MNGYDNPWSAGGGKNLYNKNDSSMIKYNTYLEPETGKTLQMIYETRCLIVPCKASTTYTISNGVKTTMRVGSFTSDPPLNTYPTSANSPSGQTEIGTGLSITTGASDTCLVIQVMANDDISGGMTLENAVAKLMVEEGSSVSAWQPYSNTCPIFGWTEANVTRTGKNLLRYPYHNTTLTKNGITFTDNGDGSITLNGTSTA